MKSRAGSEDRSGGLEKRGFEMKAMTMTALIAGQLMASASPALAGSFPPAESHQAGAFGGVRVRLPLDGARSERRVRAGVTLAPTLHSQSVEGGVQRQLRIGEGLELGVTGRDQVRLSLAGRDVRQLGAQEGDEDGGGVPTWALIAGGVVVVAGAGLLWFVDAMNDSSE